MPTETENKLTSVKTLPAAKAELAKELAKETAKLEQLTICRLVHAKHNNKCIPALVTEVRKITTKDKDNNDVTTTYVDLVGDYLDRNGVPQKVGFQAKRIGDGWHWPHEHKEGDK